MFIVNDRLDIALASKADGVHLGQDDLDIKTVRKLLGASKIIGVSANNSTDINKAVKDGCEYIGVGPVFPTLTKNINIPCFAIGGINKLNISSLKNLGISKVAIVSGLLNSEDPKDEAMIIIKELSHEN